jgi:hypothetical protein
MCWRSPSETIFLLQNHHLHLSMNYLHSMNSYLWMLQDYLSHHHDRYCMCNFLCLFLTCYSEAAHLYKPSGCLWQVAPEYFDQANRHPSTHEIVWCNLPWPKSTYVIPVYFWLHTQHEKHFVKNLSLKLIVKVLFCIHCLGLVLMTCHQIPSWCTEACRHVVLYTVRQIWVTFTFTIMIHNDVNGPIWCVDVWVMWVGLFS